jgi:light-regulated signal transduction histidine kinase (bacteriophytochrome)
MIDEYCLGHALANLLDNAVKFTEHGRVMVRVYRDADGRICLNVEDTGTGVDPSYLPRLFEPFSQEDGGQARRYEGMGLGLALAKRLRNADFNRALSSNAVLDFPAASVFSESSFTRATVRWRSDLIAAPGVVWFNIHIH